MTAWPTRRKFTEQQFLHDLTGLLSQPAHLCHAGQVRGASAACLGDGGEVQLKLHWATVVGTFADTRDLHVVKNGDRWAAGVAARERAARAAAGHSRELSALGRHLSRRRRRLGRAGCGSSARAHCRHASRGARREAWSILGELLNEDVVPASVSVNATLLSKKDQSPIATEGSFDKISHLLLPKQVTPFLITFPNVVAVRRRQHSHDAFSNLISRRPTR